MKKVVTFGELMLRITPPAREMILQTPNMVCTFGGAEANVAVAVSAYGDDTKFVTALPKNDLGRAYRRLPRVPFGYGQTRSDRLGG